MAANTPSTTSSSAGARSPDAQHRVLRKRNRLPLSCAPCRHRKLKCNRAHPCENCVKRGDGSSCAYVAPRIRKTNQSSHGSSNSDQMQSRIDRLEGLVLALMTSGGSAVGPSAAAAALAGDTSARSSNTQRDNADDDGMAKEKPAEEDGDVEKLTKSFGVMKVDAKQSTSMYVGESHWAAVLDEISEVRNHLIEHKKQFDEQVVKVAASQTTKELKAPGFLFCTPAQPDKEELFAALPSRKAVDRIVARYFNSCDPAIHILHVPTFQEEYEAYWANPAKTSVVWLGQLFAMLSLAMQSYHRAGDEPPDYKGRTMQESNAYRTRTIECLVLANFSKPVSPMIETLVLHLHGEYMRSAEIESWMMGGLIVRLAMRMGYHRDPKPWPNITPFQGEIRRRVWTFVRMVDLLLSFQIGLPSMIRSAHCDTALPRNLYDEEFGKGTTALPPSRPITEATPVSYMITKAQLAFTFGDIIELTSSVTSGYYDEVMKLDERLREARASMPLHLRMRPTEDSRMDPANLIMQRFNLELLYQKSLCVLHKKFLARARTNSRYAHSRRACVDASLELMRHQANLRQENLLYGRLQSVNWFVQSLTSHDFLFAAMILCLDLHHGLEAESPGLGSNDISLWGLERRPEMMQALETSNTIWAELRDESMEAYKANEVLTVMLGKLTKRYPSASSTTAPAPSTSYAFASHGGYEDDRSATFVPDDSKPEHSAAMTLGMLSSGGVTSNTAAGVLDRRAYPSSLSAGNTPTPMNTDSPGFSMLNSYSAADPMQAMTGDATSSSLFTMLGQQSSNMMDMPASYDWETWDMYIQGTSIDPMNQLWPLTMSDAPIDNTTEEPNTTKEELLIDIDEGPTREQQQQPQQQMNSTTGYPTTGGSSNVAAAAAADMYMGLNPSSDTSGI